MKAIATNYGKSSSMTHKDGCLMQLVIEGQMAEILVACEGSGGSGHHTRTMEFGASGFVDQLLCQMCGSFLAPGSDGRVPDHQRDDILARLARGDFDEPQGR